MGYKQRSTIKLLGERPDKKSKYVVVPKELLLDGGLTSDARLVAIYLLSLSDGWETNQKLIAEALGWPTKSKRVGNAMQNLMERGWLGHNEYKSGNRTYKHEWVMNRSHRLNTVESTTLYAVDSTVSPKYQSKRTSGDSADAPMGTPAASSDGDLWVEQLPYYSHCYALPEEEPHGEGCPPE